ncbi:MAG: SGNH/GDSL hydrolase family protein [Planctomycetota bacterium]
MAGTHANGTEGLALGSSPANPTSRGTRLRRGLVVSIFTLALLTLAVEVYLRVTDFRESTMEAGVNRTNRRWVQLLGAGIFEEIGDPMRHYAMRPGASAEVDGWTFRVSSHRTRGADFPREKPAGEKRLLCLGDSFAFGLWADEDETLVGHLARMATEAEAAAGTGVTWRGVNLGVPGYHSGQQLRAFEQDGLDLAPDAVVLYYNTNDIVAEGLFLDEDLGALYSDHLPLPTGLRRPLWEASYLYSWIVHKYTRSFHAIPAPMLDERVPWAHVRADNKDATAGAIRRVAELCAERDVPLFFVNQPLLTWSGDVRREDWGVLPLVGWAEDLRAELGLPGISLLGLLRNYADNIDRSPAPPDEGFLVERYIADEAVQEYFAGNTEAELPPEPDFHFTGDGYGHIARLCYPLLRDAGILP